MRLREILIAGLVFVAAASGARADGLPICRVRVVASGAAEAVAKSVIGQVREWVDVRDRGCTLASSIDEADVLLELHGYGPTTTQDGTPGEEWRFIARRLSEPVRERGTYRFGYTTWLDRRTRAHVAKQLPTVLGDVCLGYLPKIASADVERE